MSAHAGDPLLINLEWLVERGWLSPLKGPNEAQTTAEYRLACLEQAFAAFKQENAKNPWLSFIEFVEAHADWLEDYALYIALHEEYGGVSWHAWPQALRDRQSKALAAARQRLEETISRAKFEQFIFFQQWKDLRDFARSKGVILFGDMPIFVAYDSADVWANREFFDLTADGLPRVVAGVPPDYFSAVGQRWGNPHYDWKKMQDDGFSWWIGRMASQMEMYDWVRIDHFRGFEAYWEISSDQPTAIHGRWVSAPGEALLERLYEAFPGEGLPLVAENLGIITAEVEALRDRFAIPGMLVLQFAFDGGPGNPYLPHNHVENNVVYTGTHDNDTSLSWFEGLSEGQQNHVLDYLGHPKAPMPLALVQSALASVARLAILPMQDILGLGGEHRMNTPGTVGQGNWRWRFEWKQVEDQQINELSHLVRLYGRA
jgi:4-alpha-glucanotransferase